MQNKVDPQLPDGVLCQPLPDPRRRGGADPDAEPRRVAARHSRPGGVTAA